jgi:hypothetical protein
VSQATLEQRVTELEKRVRGLLADQAAAGRTTEWRRTRGAFSGDDLMEQVFREGRKIREAERKRAHARGGTTRRPLMILLDTDHLLWTSAPRTDLPVCAASASASALWI